MTRISVLRRSAFDRPFFDRATSWGMACLVCIVGLAGCDAPPTISELKLRDEPLTRHELREFLSIVEGLPGKRLPPMPTMALAAPSWSLQRTLPVKELLQEQRKGLDDRLTVEVIVRHLRPVRGLNRALRREGWSLERFASVVLSVAAAINRFAVSDEQMLTTILERGRKPLLELEADGRVFAGLRDDSAFAVLDRAEWIPLVHRAKWLTTVPVESVQLVRSRRKELEAVFAPDVFEDPFAPFKHVLRDEGTPFEELPESGTDAEIPLSLGMRPR